MTLSACQQLGFIGLGRMGAAMVRRITQAGIQCVVFDKNPDSKQLVPTTTVFNTSIEEMIGNLPAPRHIWLMLPAAVVDSVIETLLPLLEKGDTLIDGEIHTSPKIFVGRRGWPIKVCIIWTSVSAAVSGARSVVIAI